MKRALLACLLAPALFFGRDASADELASLGRASLSVLPEASFQDAVAKVPTLPKKIAADESVGGIVVRGDADRMITDAPGVSGGCYSLDANGTMAREGLAISSTDPVVFVRVERLSPSAEGSPVRGEARLTVETLFVDPRTRGMQRIGTGSIALTAIAVAAGTAVYAYRDGSNVHVVWPMVMPVRFRDAQNPFGFGSRCGHGHMVLDAKEPNGPRASAAAASSIALIWEGKTKSKDFRVTASVSQSTRDPEAVLSVGVAVRPEPGPRSAQVRSIKHFVE